MLRSDGLGGKAPKGLPKTGFEVGVYLYVEGSGALGPRKRDQCGSRME